MEKRPQSRPDNVPDFFNGVVLIECFQPFDRSRPQAGGASSHDIKHPLFRKGLRFALILLVGPLDPPLLSEFKVTTEESPSAPGTLSIATEQQSNRATEQIYAQK